MRMDVTVKSLLSKLDDHEQGKNAQLREHLQRSKGNAGLTDLVSHISDLTELFENETAEMKRRHTRLSEGRDKFICLLRQLNDNSPVITMDAASKQTKRNQPLKSHIARPVTSDKSRNAVQSASEERRRTSSERVDSLLDYAPSGYDHPLGGVSDTLNATSGSQMTTGTTKAPTHGRNTRLSFPNSKIKRVDYRKSSYPWARDRSTQKVTEGDNAPSPAGAQPVLESNDPSALPDAPSTLRAEATAPPTFEPSTPKPEQPVPQVSSILDRKPSPPISYTGRPSKLAIQPKTEPKSNTKSLEVIVIDSSDDDDEPLLPRSTAKKRPRQAEESEE
ncbi:hypothetical protein K461DRAFT_160683 [Myriangium duriaei CBS 260.36]|uniref:Uncharacterized protein n=1 Tax=Myriangium duriaei CBS 260.36 TaxID=1168546 RepID=A0A9P4J0U6_9PEZI|nr:hypothetical protein K461DRAFT_160683 [Myriangium duriaei CBS 260.36]